MAGTDSKSPSQSVAVRDHFAPAVSCAKSRSRSPAEVSGVEVPRPRFRSSSFFFFCQFAAAAAWTSRVAAVVPTAAAATAVVAAVVIPRCSEVFYQPYCTILYITVPI